VALDAYQARVHDLIALDSRYVPVNISRARIRSLQAQGTATLTSWRTQGYLTPLQLKQVASADTGKRLPRRPERTARVDVDRRFGAFGAGATLFAASGRCDDAANLHRLGGYATAGLRASYAFSRGWPTPSTATTRPPGTSTSQATAGTSGCTTARRRAEAIPGTQPCLSARPDFRHIHGSGRTGIKAP
jgi:hypothetical protein